MAYVATHKAENVVVEVTKEVSFTTAFLMVTNIAVAFCKSRLSSERSYTCFIVNGDSR